MDSQNVLEDLEKIRNYYSEKLLALLIQKNKKRVNLEKLQTPTPIKSVLPKKKERVEIKHNPIKFPKSKYQQLAEFEYNLRKKGRFYTRDELQILFLQSLRAKSKTQSTPAKSTEEEFSHEQKRLSSIKGKKRLRDLIYKNKIIEKKEFKKSFQINEFVQDKATNLDVQFPQVKMSDLTSLEINFDDFAVSKINFTNTQPELYQIRNKLKMMINKKVKTYLETSQKLLGKYQNDSVINIQDLVMKDILNATVDGKVENKSQKIEFEGSLGEQTLKCDELESAKISDSPSKNSEDSILYLKENLGEFSRILDWEELNLEGKLVTHSYTPEKEMWINYTIDD